MKFKVGDRFICLNCPDFGFGTITAVYDDEQYYDVHWDQGFNGDRSFLCNIISEDLYDSPLYQALL